MKKLLLLLTLSALTSQAHAQNAARKTPPKSSDVVKLAQLQKQMFTQSRETLALQRKLAGLQANQAREDANKKLVLDFYQQFFGDKDVTAADRYLLPSYIQHNPMAATGRDAVKKFFTPFFANPAIPKSKIDVKRVAADGDLVWLHTRSGTTGAERAVVDIFRIENGKIAEHWDVVQSVPAQSANANTMF